MLLEDMLDDLGYEVAGTAGGLDEALGLARDADVDVAILDVNLNGNPVYPVADVLAGRGVPFMFSTGYGEQGLPEAVSRLPHAAEAVPAGEPRAGAGAAGEGRRAQRFLVGSRRKVRCASGNP